MSNYTCFHCDHPTNSIHRVTFYQEQEEQNELLCDHCYDEWLMSIKE